MDTFRVEHTPAEVVKLFPKASDLFKEARIDFCCGGDQPLQAVFEKRKNIDGQAVMDALNKGYQEWQEDGHQNIDWTIVSSAELINHIVERHHRYLEQELDPLSQFVTKIFRVHGNNHPHLKQLYQNFHAFKAEIEPHLVTEEQDLFPLIREYEQTGDAQLKQDIERLNGQMEKEHQRVGELLKEMRDLTNAFTPPEGACNSYRITYARLAELENNTLQHIYLENHILPQLTIRNTSASN